ncbi:MAG: YpdA family putative bacillithiol disulfide reductase [Gemmatimonadetes bacterium]|uniref:YpdA family putative bacillithiol disulfide reductase n=1 Tax=Candidatus Kutchimonas denitrificans TaxID=3056748 RepID=A0AAE5C8F6_9BACT|nr:YpdA family putative bacillithiol disulfide reductase [Gemmatimonadota bacterium]NIR74446.1 YpdA family putative bacillithiol disulfide reductase [Candidatus Kutchimonas denitrificans]NIS00842.1 YpdA family putative bacillithiol disulfide reductase [Gemmatimonadota bacterium]NIT66465.1 YpdA family putative bacillithiol disulfide reductase [Gemmatimonadota bacterium]NIU52096.1 YpdA family putative bacillithiol disulfide reductase [Gemmatimonadota bacterium]
MNSSASQASGRVDLAIVGAGPCGLAVGAAARRAGLSSIIFDRGCVVNALVGYPLNMTFFSTPENLEIGDVPFVTRDVKPTRHEALTYYRRVAGYFELDVRQYEEVLDVEGAAADFWVKTRMRDGTEAGYPARNIVIATGRFDTPNLLGVPGEDLPKVTHYYREAHPYYDQACLVVGGGNSAAEAALDLWRSGARVTLVHFLDEFDPGVKPWVRPDIENRIREGSIAARFRTRVHEIGPDFVTLQREDGPDSERLANDWVFAMTGYRPDIPFLRRLGIDVDGDTGIPVHDPDTMETNLPGIFIAGVLAAGYDANKIFIENGKLHGDRIVNALTGSRSD